MKKIILLIVIAVLLAVTNPTKNDFQSWAGEQVGAESETQLEEMLSTVIGVPVVNLTAEKSDYVLFSVFTVDIPGHEEIRVLGVLKQFVHLSSTRLSNIVN